MLTSKSISSIQSLSFSPDHQSIVVGSEDGSIRIWQKEKIEPQIITAHNGYVNS
jgi:WD40 repeat protein